MALKLCGMKNVDKIIIKELEINKTNISKITTNSKRSYVYGIGWTDYTIHKDAKDLKHYYNGAGGFIKNFSIQLMNQYHHTQWLMRSLVSESKFKEEIVLNGIKYKIHESYYGLHNRIKLYIPQGRGYQSMKWEGENLPEIKEKIKIVLHLEEIK